MKNTNTTTERFMSDKQRAEFEKWAKGKGCNTERHNDINQESLDWYAYDSTDFAWQAWQSAIASVVVELPLWEHKNGYQVYPVSDVKDSLNKAGVRYE